VKVFIDTEFWERPLSSMGAGTHSVQLISLGAVREDGAEFYVENADFDWNNVPEDHWLQDNVRPHLMGQKYPLPEDPEKLFVTDGVGGYWSPSRIAEEFFKFAAPAIPTTIVLGVGTQADLTYSPPEFWGYFCDYDWVVLCGLYGRMVDLPPEFPMSCMDLKQEMVRASVKRSDLPAQSEQSHHALADARWVRDAYLQTRVWEGGEF
jgi:hypothetical protein